MKMHKSKTESQTFMLAICGTLCSTVDCFIFSDFQLLLWLLSILTEMV